MKNKIRILVIANNAFNLQSSNGRTLGNLLRGFDKNDLLELCITGDTISFELIKNCYRISDTMMVKGISKHKVEAEKLKDDKEFVERCSTTELLEKREKPTVNRLMKPKRTPLSMLIREYIWSPWREKTNFLQLSEQFFPDVVLYQMGDNSFLVDMAIEIGDRCSAPIITYTTEDYYFKEWDYLNKRNEKGLLYSFFHSNYKNSLSKLMNRTNLLIANTPDLANRYEQEFDIKTDWIMASATDFSTVKYENNDRIIYAGSLDVGRHKSLIEIAKVLDELGLELDVYGAAAEQIISEMDSEKNINLLGMVDYEIVKRKMYGARLVVHAESLEGYYVKDCSAAFSTKIPDCLACGVPLFVYAPRGVAATEYLESNKNAFVCSEHSKLKETISVALYDVEQRNEVLTHARESVNKNHNMDANNQKMKNLLAENI